MATPISNMTVTWNNAGTTFNAIKMNVTDTASNAASLLMDLQVGGTSRINASKAGALRVTNGTAAAPAISSVAATNVGFNFPSQFNIDVVTGGAVQAMFDQGNPSLTLGATWAIAWGSSGITSPDVYIRRDAANTLAQRNATNPQAFNIYNTYTSSTNYERGFVSWLSNTFCVGTEKGSGGGTARSLQFRTDGVGRWFMDTNGHFTAVTDSAYDIGASGANRPRNVYVAVDVRASGSLEVGSGSFVYFNNRTVLSSSADGLLRVSNQSGSDFGRLQFGGTTSSFPSLKRETNTLRVRLADDSGDAQLIAHRLTAAGGILENNTTFYTDNSGVRTSQTGYFGFSSSGLTGGVPDVYLYRDAANTLAQRNATNAQTFRVYNTYTDASNYERGVFSWSSNVFRIATENAGTGSSRTIQLYPSSGNVDIIDGSSVAQISFNIQSSNGLRVASDRPIGFTPGGANLAAPDTTLRRVAAGILGVRGGLITDAGALSFIEQTAPAAPAANGVYIYAEDNGAGKTRLMALFATGVAQQIAIEP